MSVRPSGHAATMQPGPQFIDNTFKACRAEGRAALLVCVPLGYEPGWAIRAARAAFEAGADMLEFQTRYPMHPSVALATVADVSSFATGPVILWADDSTIRDFGLVHVGDYPLAEKCLEAGVSGVAAPLRSPLIDRWADECGDRLAPIFFVGPGMSEADLGRASARGRGFLYGIGLETSPPASPAVAAALTDFVEPVRQDSGLPIIVGAGIATREQAALAATVCDGIAVAKAVFTAVEAARGRGDDGIDDLRRVVSGLRQAIETSAPTA